MKHVKTSLIALVAGIVFGIMMNYLLRQFGLEDRLVLYAVIGGSALVVALVVLLIKGRKRTETTESS